MKIQHAASSHARLGDLAPGDIYMCLGHTYMRITGTGARSSDIASVNMQDGVLVTRGPSHIVSPCPMAVLHTHHVEPDDEVDE